MCKTILRSMYSLAGVAGVIAIGVILGGCAIFDASERAGTENAHLSLKEQWKPTSTQWGTTTLTKLSYAPAPQRAVPASRPGAKVAVDVNTNGCSSSRECLARLKALIDDPRRKWISRPPTPAEHASGIRQFGYRALRTKLSCREMALAINEMSAITSSDQGEAPDRIVSIRALDALVEAELRAERASRCRTADRSTPGNEDGR
jgi:uncharacterized Fe-S cluster protein YjdI